VPPADHAPVAFGGGVHIKLDKREEVKPRKIEVK
jgi:hypothetical protein